MAAGVSARRVRIEGLRLQGEKGADRCLALLGAGALSRATDSRVTASGRGYDALGKSGARSKRDRQRRGLEAPKTRQTRRAQERRLLSQELTPQPIRLFGNAAQQGKDGRVFHDRMG